MKPENDVNLKQLPIYTLAQFIKADWKNVYFGAKPYLSAMQELTNIDEKFGCDSASSVITYFLANAQTWRGPIAREIKAELNRRLKEV